MIGKSITGYARCLYLACGFVVYQMDKNREVMLTATLFALPPDHTTFFHFYMVFQNQLEEIGSSGTKGAEYLALAVRLTRRINVLRAQRDSGAMAGMLTCVSLSIAILG